MRRLILLLALAGCGDGLTGYHRYQPGFDAVSAEDTAPHWIADSCRHGYLDETGTRARYRDGEPCRLRTSPATTGACRAGICEAPQ